MTRQNLMVNHHKRITELNDHELQDPINEDCSDQGSENGEDEFLFSASVSGQETTLKSVQVLFRKQDRTFNRTFDSLENKFWNANRADKVD